MSILVTTLFGCASTKSTISKSYVTNHEAKVSLTIDKNSGVSIPAGQYHLLESQIRSGLAERGVLASNGELAQHSAVVNLHSFRMRDDAARLTVGILAGCDSITSTVVVIDKSTFDEVGNSKISIKECAAWGVADQVIKKYTDGVVAFLSGKYGA